MTASTINEFHSELKANLPTKPADLADFYGLSRARISQIMNGHTKPPLWMVLDLYVRYNVDLFATYFLYYTPTKGDWRTCITIIQRETGRTHVPAFETLGDPASYIRNILKAELPEDALQCNSFAGNEAGPNGETDTGSDE